MQNLNKIRKRLYRTFKQKELKKQLKVVNFTQ